MSPSPNQGLLCTIPWYNNEEHGGSTGLPASPPWCPHESSGGLLPFASPCNPLPILAAFPSRRGLCASQEWSQADPAVRKRTLTSAPKPSQRARKGERALYCNSSAVSSLALLAVHALQIFPACYHASATCSAAKPPLTPSCWLELFARLCLPLSSAVGLGLVLGFFL